MEVLRNAHVTLQLNISGVESIRGVALDDAHVWFAHGDIGELIALDPTTSLRMRTLEVAADAGVAFDGECLWVAAGTKLRRVHPVTAAVLAEFESPAGADTSGLAYRDGELWVGSYRAKRIHVVDSNSGLAKRALEASDLVTGLSFRGDELWCGAVENDELGVRSRLLLIDQQTGLPRQTRVLPAGIFVSGMAFDGAGRLWCGDPVDGALRVVMW